MTQFDNLPGVRLGTRRTAVWWTHRPVDRDATAPIVRLSDPGRGVVAGVTGQGSER